MMSIMKKSKNNMIPSTSKISVDISSTHIHPQFRWLLVLTLLLAIAMPIVMYSGRVQGVGEFEYHIYFRQLFFDDYFNSLAMLFALLVVVALRPLWQRVELLAQWISRYPVKTCIFAFVVCAALGYLIYQEFPLTMDEYAPLLQARIFAQGNLAITYPLELLDRIVIPDVRDFILVNSQTGQAISAYWPGLALLMTPFSLFELEWLLNPLLAAIGLWLIGDLASQASGQPQARGWAILATLACPQYTINAMSYYAMTSLLTFNLLYLWLLLKNSWRNTLLAGVVGGFALGMHNPVPHGLFAIPCVVFLLFNRHRYIQILPLVIGYLPLVLLLCLGRTLLIHFLELDINTDAVLYEDTDLITTWLQNIQKVFILPDLRIVIIRTYALCKMVVWASPGLLLVLFFSKPNTLIQRILLACLIFSFAFYLFIPYDQGYGWGYRYIHSAWGLIAIGAGIFAVSGHKFQRNFIAISLLAGILATPIFVLQASRTIANTNTLHPEIPTKFEGKILVFITLYPSLYTHSLIQNYPKDRENIIRMVSYGMEEDAALAKQLSPEALQLSVNPMGSVWQLPVKSSLHLNMGVN